MLAKHKARQTTIPAHGDADFDPALLRRVCKQLGIDPDDIL
ncbi:MAG: hypothetical protein M3436_08730 [Pseudomonadota bacterium]|nr:hypothetical protein [Pseudomonadota bacterium]